MRGKCNCGKKAKTEWLIFGKNVVTTIKFCDECAPKQETKKMYKI